LAHCRTPRPQRPGLNPRYRGGEAPLTGLTIRSLNTYRWKQVPHYLTESYRFDSTSLSYRLTSSSQAGNWGHASAAGKHGTAGDGSWETCRRRHYECSACDWTVARFDDASGVRSVPVRAYSSSLSLVRPQGKRRNISPYGDTTNAPHVHGGGIGGNMQR